MRCKVTLRVSKKEGQICLLTVRGGGIEMVEFCLRNKRMVITEKVVYTLVFMNIIKYVNSSLIHSSGIAFCIILRVFTP